MHTARIMSGVYRGMGAQRNAPAVPKAAQEQERAAGRNEQPGEELPARQECKATCGTRRHKALTELLYDKGTATLMQSAADKGS